MNIKSAFLSSVLLSLHLFFLTPLICFLSLSLLISKVEQPLPITSPKKGSKRGSVAQMEEAGDNV